MIILVIPLIPLIAYAGIAGSASTLYWYNSLSPEEKDAANRWLAEKIPFFDGLNEDEIEQIVSSQDTKLSEFIVQEKLNSADINENEVKQALYDTRLEINRPLKEDVFTD